jgi:hypothetical protein
MRGRFANKMYPVFTGYITNTSYSNRGGYWSITLDCSDVTKLLSINPINVNPAIAERRMFGRVFVDEDFKISAWSFPFTNMKLEDIIRTLIEGTRKEALTETGRIAVDGIGLIEMWKNPLFPTPEEKKSGENVKGEKFEGVKFVIEAYKFFEPKIRIYTSYDIVPYKYLDLANRQVFSSDMVSRMDIIREVVERTFHEFFADEVGDFVLLPMRINYKFLKYDFIDPQTKKFGRFKSREDIKDGTYILTEDEVLNMSLSFSDKEVYTAVDVYGEYPFTSGSSEYVEWALRGFAQDYALIKRLGLRWLRRKEPLINNMDLLLQGDSGKKLQEQLEAQHKELEEAWNREQDPKKKKELENNLLALEASLHSLINAEKKNPKDVQALLDAYANALLRFLNSKAYSGSVSLVLRPEMVPAKPVYIPDRDELFYIDSVTHSITVGGNATTDLTLTLGRKTNEVVEIMDYLMSLHNPEIASQAISEVADKAVKKFKEDKEEIEKKLR